MSDNWAVNGQIKLPVTIVNPPNPILRFINLGVKMFAIKMYPVDSTTKKVYPKSLFGEYLGKYPKLYLQDTKSTSYQQPHFGHFDGLYTKSPKVIYEFCPRLYTRLTKVIYQITQAYIQVCPDIKKIIGLKLHKINKLGTEILVPMPYFIQNFF